jgi:hypothetical protein
LEDISLSLRFNKKSKLDRYYKVAHGVMLVGFSLDSDYVAKPLKFDCGLGLEAAARTIKKKY